MKGLFITDNLLNYREPDAWIDLPKALFGDSEGLFVAVADGNGMCKAGIFDGDLMIIDAGATPESGDIAVVMVNGEPVCRRILFDNHSVTIRREDGRTPDIVSDTCIIMGVVVQTVRHLRKGGAPWSERTSA